ncbi:MAG: hypothetical protein IT317_13400 [Anaerolineales bacterium]|nr:hypothetical protein [Anaerolineales bacterium]
MRAGDSQPAEPLIQPLTRRERDILALLAQGHTAPEIAEHLTLAVSSVKWYVRQLYSKLGVNRKRQAIARAEALGLLDQPPPAAPTPPPTQLTNNLPVPVTRFFGREEELAQLVQRLGEHRLVTLTGAGGVGKTRLSLEAAGRVLNDFADGVWLVELAPLTNPALVPGHVAAVLGVRETPGRPIRDSLLTFLRDRQALLVLDNCEHLLAACAQLVEALLRACPNLKVLASSREPLAILGEAVYGVRSLPFPDVDHLPPLEALVNYTAVRLFVDRARLVEPNYQANAQNAAALARICQRLDGIPLAIEMAAARVNVLSTTSLAERLEDTFRVLTGGSRTALPRQQTLRATIDWSYELLSAAERRLFQRLSVFVGGCRLEAAEVVCADDDPAADAATGIALAEVLNLLSSLVSKSMVIAERRGGAPPRYRLLETMRQYAREKLHLAGESERLHARHLRYFGQLALEAAPHLRGPQQLTWLDHLEHDLDNIWAALAYSQSSRDRAETAAGLQLAVALSRFWWLRGHEREAYAWLEAALAQPNAAERNLQRAEALQAAAAMYFVTPDVARARAMAEESVAIFAEAGPAGRRGLAYALITLGDLSHLLDDFAPKLSLLNESIAILRELDDKWGLAWALHKLAETLDPLVNYLPRRAHGAPAPLPALPPAARNDHSAERALFEESLALFRELGDRWGQTMNLTALAQLNFCLGQRPAGRAILEALLPERRAFGDWAGVANNLGLLGRDALAHNDLERAARLFDEWLRVRRRINPDDENGMALLLQAELARRQGNYAQARQLMAGVLAGFQKLGNRDFIAAVLDGQGRVARSEGAAEQAAALQREALLMRREAGHPINLAHSFHALALLAAAPGGRPERAARLLGAAQPYLPALYAYWATLPIWRAEHEQALAAVRAALGSRRAKQLMREGEALSLEQAYAYALEAA